MDFSSEQSAKSKHGNEFNAEVSIKLKSLSNIHFQYLGEEISISDDDNQSKYIAHSKNTVRVDHMYCFVNHATKTVIVIIDDCTTTYRGDRIKSKAMQANQCKKLEPQFLKFFFRHHANLMNYKIFFKFIVLFPEYDKLNTKESTEIRLFCNDVNSGISYLCPKFGIGNIDAAFSIDCFELLINIVSSHPETINDSIFETIWNKYFFLDIANRPIRSLLQYSSNEDTDWIIFDLKHYPYKYSSCEIIQFLELNNSTTSKSRAKNIQYCINILNKRKNINKVRK